MTIIIKNVNDIAQFKKYVSDNPTQNLCYVFYKKNLRYPNVYYVGFTSQYGIAKYYYLNSHHKMKDLNSCLNNGYSIQIYTKYNERGLIELFKPHLNKVIGTGICGRECGFSDLRNVGDVIGKNYEKRFIKKPNCIEYSNEENVWEYIFNKKKYFTLFEYIYDHHALKILNYIIEKNINKKISINDREIINDPLFDIVNEEYKKRKYNSILSYNRLFSILAICKLDFIYLSYIIIHEIYKKNILWHLNNLNKNECKCSSCGKIYKKKGFLKKHIENTGHRQKEDWFKTFFSVNNKHIICSEILEELKKRDYLISNTIKDNRINLWFYYSQSNIYDAYIEFKLTNKELNYSPYELDLSIRSDSSNKSVKLVFVVKQKLI
jgi:hypothetical protein